MKKYEAGKKSILFMAQLPPPVHGAALRNKSLLESDLINSNFNIYSLPLKFIDDMQDLGKFSLKKILLMIGHSVRMCGILIKQDIDLVYFTMSPSGGSFYRDIVFMTIIKLFGKKRILHFRVKGIRKTSLSMIGKLLVKYAFRGSEIVCLSHHHMHDVEGLAYTKPYIVPNGIKVENNHSDAPAINTNDSGAVANILFLSNLSSKKGVPQLIEALKILNEKGYRFSASLVGNEWDLSFKDVGLLVEKAGLSGLVIIEGPKYEAEKFSFLERADIFVFPTYFELFPGVILEAMQFGKAIVSTFEGSIPEMIDNHINGLLVEPKSTVELAEAIAFMIDNPEKRNEMAQLARKKFFEEFTLGAFERKMNEVFEDVIAKDTGKQIRNGS